jgi:hypothetical protein
MDSNKLMKYLNKLTSFFKLIEEHSQENIACGIIKNDTGELFLKIMPRGSNETTSVKISDFFVYNHYRSFLRKKEQRLIELLILCEGDIFLESKSFGNNKQGGSEILNLTSVISKEKWSVTREELLQNNSLLTRLNKKYFTHELTI